jgi:cyclopropane fatty-acyl-phospholipid synthase-like methyltransferase
MANSNIDLVVSQFKNFAVTYEIHLELEVRFQDITKELYFQILTTLQKQQKEVISQTVNIIKKEDTQKKKSSLIRELTFSKGKKISEQFLKKEQITIPMKITNTNALSYKIVVSSEQKINSKFTSDERVLIRVKQRHSFNLNDSWRIDMTAVREIMGSEIDSLQNIIKEMFGCDDIRLNNNRINYEIEIEYIGSQKEITTANILESVNYILNLANPNHIDEAILHAEINKVAQIIAPNTGKYGLKRILPQAISITRADYRDIFPPKNMYLTDKADGKRALAVLRDGKFYFLSDKLYYATANNATANNATANNATANNATTTVLDGEFIEEKQKFYAFDVIMVDGLLVINDGFEKRLDYIQKAVDIFQKSGIQVYAKPYIHLTGENLEAEIKSVYERERPYDIDGLIFVSPKDSYMSTKNYKWKPSEHNTIDFLVRKVPGEKKKYFLFVGININLFETLGLQWCPGYSDLFKITNSNYFPIQFSPSDNPNVYITEQDDPNLDGKIVEMRYDGENWILAKIRNDRDADAASGKYFGNDFYVANSIWLNYMDPFPIEQLWDGPLDNYFTQTRSDIYNAQTGLINFAKEERIMNLQHADWVIDIGAGKGQDLFRYLKANVRHLIAVDKDKSALLELVRRRFKDAVANHRKKSNTVIYVLAADANDPFKENIKRFSNFGAPLVDAMVCNLAVHYFLGDINKMRNFISLARNMIKPGGYMILTIIIGEEVHSILKNIPENETWDVIENSSKKFSIKKLYSSENLESAGQKIGVMLPFRTDYYEEYLVNTKVFIQEFNNHGFTLLSFTKLIDVIPNFEVKNKALAMRLTDGDKQWISLFGELVFKF